MKAVPLVLALAAIAALAFVGWLHMRKRKREQRVRVALEPPRGKPDPGDLVPNRQEREWAEEAERARKVRAQWMRDNPGLPYPGDAPTPPKGTVKLSNEAKAAGFRLPGEKL